MNLKEKALKVHEGGKISITPKIKVTNKEELSLAYTPGVAHVSLEIASNPSLSYLYTSKSNTIAIISDGSAVLGLGNIGPLAAMPVMEGKALLFKEFGGVNAVPLCLNTQDTEELITIIKNLAPSFGGINLEDIAAPRCVEIERALVDELDIPVFHDDQHGTAIVVAAGLLNACRLTKKDIKDLKIVISGTGAAGSAIARILKAIGVKTINAFNLSGVVAKEKYESYNFLVKELLDNKIIDSPANHNDTLASILKGADVFIGVSAPNLVTKEMIKEMNDKPFVFALANPTPEIMPEEALKGGAYVVATGRSDYNNQINNVLAFPGLFKGVLKAKIKKITTELKIKTAQAIASVITDDELSCEYIIPSAFDERVVQAVYETILNYKEE